PDLLFLDIQMPDLNGLELAKLVSNDTKIIFTSAFQQYALEGFKVNALDYLLKPIDYAEFLNASNKALDWFNMTKTTQYSDNKENKKRSIFVKTDYKLIQIELDKITHIEGLKDYVKIYVEGEQYPILSLMSMKSMEALLPTDQFIRVHKSYIVQPQKIKVIERNRIVFGKTYIPISDTYKENFQNFVNKYSIFN
ncbi:MAG: response regulator transcription factor, partial [Paludibacteraceae bacterium]|nr:response regulator transcription factor [Paludibacteraceae bacterium]